MPQIIDPAQFLTLAKSLPVVDVRSPGEFQKGHIPGAVNLPLFDNRERSAIGTLYVQSGREQAIREGMEMVGKKFGKFISDVEELVPGKEMLLHCWRGGMRSDSMAWFFERLGYKVSLLQGGYKSYRGYIRQQFSRPMKILLVGGMTGSGKTELINIISGFGQQTIDLEALANHKGSSFGHLGQEEQPSTEQFENDLFALWNCLDEEQFVWLEHESKQIGKIFMPDPFYHSMLNGILLKVELPLKIRISRLISEYACFKKHELEAVLIHLKQNMGSQKCNEAIEALYKDDFESVASLSLEYYDKTYQNALKKRPVREIHTIILESPDMETNARYLLDYVSKNVK